MDRSISTHYREMKDALDHIEGKTAHAQAEELYYYHVDRVRDFQHERFIHLLVTFFFSGLLILAIIGLLWVSSADLTSNTILAYLFGGAGVVLFVTVLLYVRHYYYLENGVQKLYVITEQLRQHLR